RQRADRSRASAELRRRRGRVDPNLHVVEQLGLETELVEERLELRVLLLHVVEIELPALATDRDRGRAGSHRDRWDALIDDLEDGVVRARRGRLPQERLGTRLGGAREELRRDR